MIYLKLLFLMNILKTKKGATPLEEIDTDGLYVDISLPPLVWDNSDQASLISEQQADSSLFHY